MNGEFKFTLVQIAPLEEFLRLTAEARLHQNELMANRLLVLEDFMNRIYRGTKFIRPQHGNSR
jgi:hypothetical protein